jgi:hypothetical protein
MRVRCPLSRPAGLLPRPERWDNSKVSAARTRYSFQEVISRQSSVLSPSRETARACYHRDRPKTDD